MGYLYTTRTGDRRISAMNSITVSPSPITKFQDTNEVSQQSWYYADQSLEDCKVTLVQDGYLVLVFNGCGVVFLRSYPPQN